MIRLKEDRNTIRCCRTKVASSRLSCPRRSTWLVLATVCLFLFESSFSKSQFRSTKYGRRQNNLISSSTRMRRTASIPCAFVSSTISTRSNYHMLHNNPRPTPTDSSYSFTAMNSNMAFSVVSKRPIKLKNRNRQSVVCELFFRASDSQPGRQLRQNVLKTLSPPNGTLETLSRANITLPCTIPLLPKGESFSTTSSDESYSLTIRPMKITDLKDDILPMCIKEFGTGPTANLMELFHSEIWQKASSGSLLDWWDRLWLEPMVSLTLRTKIGLMESRARSTAGNGQSVFGDNTLLVLCLNTCKTRHNDDTGGKISSSNGQNCQEKVVGMIELSLQPPEADRNPPAYPIPLWMKLVYSEIHHLDGLQGWITNLLIDPDHRGCGYSKILVAAVEGITRKLEKQYSCHSIYLHADANDRSGRIPQSLYEGMGYELVLESRSRDIFDNSDSSSTFGGMNMYFDSRIHMIDGVPLLFYRKRLVGAD